MTEQGGGLRKRVSEDEKGAMRDEAPSPLKVEQVVPGSCGRDTVPYMSSPKDLRINGHEDADGGDHQAHSSAIISDTSGGDTSFCDITSLQSPNAGIRLSPRLSLEKEVQSEQEGAGIDSWKSSDLDNLRSSSQIPHMLKLLSESLAIEVPEQRELSVDQIEQIDVTEESLALVVHRGGRGRDSGSERCVGRDSIDSFAASSPPLGERASGSRDFLASSEIGEDCGCLLLAAPGAYHVTQQHLQLLKHMHKASATPSLVTCHLFWVADWLGIRSKHLLLRQSLFLFLSPG